MIFRGILVPLTCTVLLAAPPGTVYTMTNWSSGNQVIALARDAAGGLSSAQFYPTTGAGTDFSLDSQGSIVMSPNRQWLLVVNAASNDITVFSIRPDGTPFFASRTLSRGLMPVSLTIHGSAVFVLNAAAPANIAGFMLGSDGSLSLIPGSTRVLTGSNPVEIAFDHSGTQLVVTEKESNLIEAFTFSNGRFTGQAVTPSAGAGPAGFAFASADRFVAAQAVLEAPDASAVSSYQLTANGHLNVVSRSVSTAQTAAASVAVTNDGKYAFVSNAGSSSITSIGISVNGSLRVIDTAAALTFQGTTPADIALSPDNTLLYNIATGTIFGYSVSSGGHLTPVTLFGGLPPSASGLVVR